MPAQNSFEKNNRASEQRSHSSSMRGFIAGGIVGATELLISYPIEYSKTQLHLDRGREYQNFRGLSDVIKHTIRKRGGLGLYRGMGIVMLFTAPREAIRFGIYEELKANLMDEKGNMSIPKNIISGATAGVCEGIVALTPIETIKVKIINDQRLHNPRYTGLLKALRLIVKEEGIKGLYQGLTPTIIRQGSNHGIRFAMVNALKMLYNGGDPAIKTPPAVVGLFGAFAGLTSVVANNPVDVVKTRIQQQQRNKIEYKNTAHCFKRILNEEGYRAFYRGCTARIIRVAVDAGYTFMCYDIITDIFSYFLD